MLKKHHHYAGEDKLKSNSEPIEFRKIQEKDGKVLESGQPGGLKGVKALNKVAVYNYNNCCYHF
jgi:hypothetical protein